MVLLALLSGVAVYTDLRFGKIYNKLTVSCMVLGIALACINSGVVGMLGSIAAAGLVLALFLLFAPKVGIGGGDIKMMMAVGTLMGVRFVIWAMLFTAVTGGALALLVMASHGALGKTIRNMMVNLYMKITFRSPIEISSGSPGLRFRYSPAIAIGSFLAFWLKPWS